MAPTESSILSNFLLSPAALPDIVSLRKFTELFPRSQQDNPEVEALYREFQHQRAIDSDDVKRNIAAEVKRGEKQRREVARARRRSDKEDLEGLDSRNIRMEVELFGASKGHTDKPHSLHTIVPELETACADMETEIAALEEESNKLLDGLRTTVGDLSDLRYGRFNRTSGEDFGQEVLQGLKTLETVCNETAKT